MRPPPPPSSAYSMIAYHHHQHHLHYVRNWRTIALFWALLSMCTAVIDALVFVQPHWIGSSTAEDSDSQSIGYFGLYDYCVTSSDDSSTATCPQGVMRLRDVLSTPFRIATVFVGASAILLMLNVVAMVLFAMISAKAVFCLCSWLQLFAFISLLTGCIVYPAGWDQDKVRQMCNSRRYAIGECEIRWAYILALVALFDIFFLCVLGFVLAYRQVKMPTKCHQSYANSHAPGTYYPGAESLFMPSSSVMIHQQQQHQSAQRRNSFQESHYSKESSTRNLHI